MEVISHFGSIFTMVLLVLLVSVVFAIMRRVRLSLSVLLIVVLLNWLGEILLLCMINFSTKSKKSFKVMTWNKHGYRPEQDYRAVASKIRSVNSDIVFLSEVFMDISHAMVYLLADVYSHQTTDFQWCAHYFYSKVLIISSIQIAVDGG